MALFKTSSEFCDMLSLLVYHNADSSYMFIQDSPSADYFLPTFKIPAGVSLVRVLTTETTDLFGSPTPVDCLLRIYKLWIPNSQNFIIHYVFVIKIDNEQKKNSKQTSGRFRGRTTWVHEHDLFKIFSMSNMKSPEVFEMATSWKNNNIHVIPEVFRSEGAQTVGNLTEMSENVIINSPVNGSEHLVIAAGFTKQIQTSLYKEFLLLCLPSFLMGQRSFCKCFAALGWQRNEQIDLFKTADVETRYGISFREFLYILAAVEPSTELAGGAAEEARNKLIFRYFDRDNDGFLKQDDMRNILMSIRRSTRQLSDPATVHKDFVECYRLMQISESTPVSMAMFLRVIQEGKIIDTTTIFRSNASVNSFLKDVGERETRLMMADLKKIAKLQPSSLTQGTPTGRRFSTAKLAASNKYELGEHSVKIFTIGTLNVDKLSTLNGWYFERTPISPSTIERPIHDEVKRKISMDQFNQDSITNEVIKSLRYINLVNKQTKIKRGTTQFSWGNIDSGLFAKRLISVCKLATEIVKREPRLVPVSSPVYVLGDLHGNFADLLHFESVLWHVGPVLCPSNLLFLGDYVDRGANGIEVIAYLFSYKVQNPSKIRLLRGNHEIRDVQKMFTFHTECQTKFGERLGAEVWSAINNTFDYLPIAATIDETIFCCHGGIPPPWLCPVISCINDIQVPLNQPDEQSALAWEIMWNDPIRSKVGTDSLEMELAANDGFAENKRRGTAHMFSCEALERFLRSNALTYLIRAHEMSPEGFNVLHKGKLISIFSSSKYCGATNDAACIMIDQGRMRMIRIQAE